MVVVLHQGTGECRLGIAARPGCNGGWAMMMWAAGLGVMLGLGVQGGGIQARLQIRFDGPSASLVALYPPREQRDKQGTHLRLNAEPNAL